MFLTSILFPIAVSAVAADGGWFRAIFTWSLILVVLVRVRSVETVKTETATVDMCGLLLALIAPGLRLGK